jgi:hypothetical protein
VDIQHTHYSIAGHPLSALHTLFETGLYDVVFSLPEKNVFGQIQDMDKVIPMAQTIER